MTGVPDDMSLDTLADQAGMLAMRSGLRIAVAESLTGGAVASRLSGVADASEWFCGGVVTYSPTAKFSILGVTRGPVNTASCAQEMAVGARRLFDSDIAVAVTGVGGPGSDEGVPAGTFFVGCADLTGVDVTEHHVPGGPRDVLEAAAAAVLRRAVLALDAMRESPDEGAGT